MSINGCMQVRIYGRSFTVHRLTAVTHIPNPNPNTRVMVDHKDRNCQYNFTSNLECVSQQQNVEKALGKQVATIPVDQEGDHGEPLIFPNATQSSKYSFGQARGAIPSSSMNLYLRSGKVLDGHILRRIYVIADDESAGIGFDLQN